MGLPLVEGGVRIGRYGGVRVFGEGVPGMDDVQLRACPNGETDRRMQGQISIF